MVHLRQLLPAAGIALNRMMDDLGQPGDTGGKAPEALIAMRRTQTELDQASAAAAGINLP